MLELIACNCKICREECLCLINGFNCTDACSCHECENNGDNGEETEDESESDCDLESDSESDSYEDDQ